MGERREQPRRMDAGMIRMRFPRRKRGHSRNVNNALREMESKMTAEFAALKAQIDRAVASINAAIAKLTISPQTDPADVTAASDLLKVAVDSLDAAVTPVV